MKKIYLTLLGICLGASLLFAQDETVKDTVWKIGGIASINLTQSYYENWTAGGIPSVAGIAFLKAYAKYEKKKWRWDNQFDLAYGLISERQRLMRKTDDKIQIDSKLGYNIKNKWFASFLASYKSQFTPGYEDDELQEVKISDFMAPAYIMTSLGFDFNPNDNFSLFLSPTALKATIVLNQDLADIGAFGVQGGEWQVQNGDSSFTSGKNFRSELGAHLKLMYKAKVLENVDFINKLELFTNYLENFGNVDLNWEGILDMKINDYLSANLRVELIYDDDIDISTGVDDEGIEQFGPRLQIKQIFGLGLSYKF